MMSGQVTDGPFEGVPEGGGDSTCDGSQDRQCHGAGNSAGDGPQDGQRDRAGPRPCDGERTCKGNRTGACTREARGGQGTPGRDMGGTGPCVRVVPGGAGVRVVCRQRQNRRVLVVSEGGEAVAATVLCLCRGEDIQGARRDAETDRGTVGRMT